MFSDNVTKLKEGLRDFITPDMSKETIDQLAGFTALIDSMQTDYNSVTKQYGELRDDYIQVVKNSSFKVDHDPMEDVVASTDSDEELINKIFGL